MLLEKISTGKFKSANSAKTARPHPFLPLFEEGMRSDYGQKNHNEWTQWTVGGGGVSGLHFRQNCGGRFGYYNPELLPISFRY